MSFFIFHLPPGLINVVEIAIVLMIHILKCVFQIKQQKKVNVEVFKLTLISNHFRNILRLFDILPNFPFTTSEKKRHY